MRFHCISFHHRETLYLTYRAGIALALSLLVSGCDAAEGVKFSASQIPLPRTYFGMHIHRADTTTPWPVPRFGAFRLWDAGVSWERLEPTKGDWRFERLDKLVALAEANGVEPLLTLGITPRWAASLPNRPFVYGYGGNSAPRDLADWENYVRMVASRYKGRIRYFELWNEPSFDEIDSGAGFYAGDVDTLVALGRSAYAILKQVSPDNRLLSPGFTDGGRRLDLFLKRGGAAITDIVASHFYEARPENIPVEIHKVRAVMLRHGMAEKPLWDTETGYAIEKTSKEGPVNDAEFGGFIARAHVLAAAAGVDRFYMYSWENILARGNKQTLVYPVATAYAQTLRWLNGVSVRECASQDRQVWICRLTLGERTAYMVWNAKEPSLWKPPAEWHALQYETLDARLVALASGDEVPLGPAPVLLKSDRGLWSAYGQKTTAAEQSSDGR